MPAIKEKKYDLTDGFRGYINSTRIHVYQGDAYLGQTDHVGAVMQSMPGVDREVLKTRALEIAAKHGVKAPAPAPAPAAPAAGRPRRAANWRCPNPRDCGDPTCDGLCGY